MKILYWTNLWWPDIGGLEVLALATVAELKKRGHEILVVADTGSHGAPAFSVWQDVPVHRFPFLETLRARKLPRIIQLEREVRSLRNSFAPNAAHHNFGGANAYFYLRARAAHPAPELLAVHSDFISWGVEANGLTNRCLRESDWICAVSRATLADTLALVPEKSSRSSVIYNGLPLPDLAATSLRFDPPHILCLGRIESDKGFDIALRAFALVRARFPAARLTIAGEGSQREALERLANKLGLDARAIFVGRLERAEVMAMINGSTMVVVPSRYREPFALVALEAAQMARPVVATRWGGLKESVADGESGILVENENVAAFANAMKFLLDNPAIARQMGQRAQERARELFGLQRCVDEYEALYVRLAHENAPNKSTRNPSG